MQYSQEHLKTMVYAEFGGQTECIMGNWKIENLKKRSEKAEKMPYFFRPLPIVSSFDDLRTLQKKKKM